MGFVANIVNEFRSSLATPEKWLTDWFGGGAETNSGARVTEDTAMNLSAVFNAVTILSGTVMQLPAILYRRQDDGRKSRATDHPEYKILHTMANPHLPASRFRQTAMGHLALWGNSYSQIDWAGNGHVRGLYPIRPDKMRVETRAGEVIYIFIPKTGPEKIFTRNNILHIPGFGYNGIVGYSVVSLARESLGLGMAAEEFGSRFFGSGTHPGLIAKHPGKIKDDAYNRLKSSLKEKHSGLGKTHKLLLLEDGLEVENISIPPEDAQFLETRKFQITEVARWFNLPPHMLKDMEHATFSNIEHQSIEFLTVNMGPWLTLWEDELMLQLLRPDELDEYYIEFKREALLKGDVKSRYEAYAIAKQNGFMTTNMILKKENEEPIGDEGDVFWAPVNMVAAQNMLEAGGKKEEKNVRSPLSPAPSLPEGEREARLLEVRAKTSAGRRRIGQVYRRLVKDAAGRIVRREVNEVRAGIRKQLKTRDAADLSAWLDEYYKGNRDYVEKNMAPVFESFAEEIYRAAFEEIGEDENIEASLRKFIKEYIEVFVVRYVESSRGQLGALINESEAEELQAVLETRLDEWEEKRPDKVAESEIVRGRNAFAAEVFFMSGYESQWYASSDSCDWCKAMHGKSIARGGVFAEGGSKLKVGDKVMKIRGSKSHPPLHSGCDCMVVAK